MKIFSLYKNFLINKNLSNYINTENKYEPKVEILPEYSNIESQINSKKNYIDDFYQLFPYFNDYSLEQNSAFIFFKNGFKKLFFGPEGLVTRKSISLKKYYKSVIPKEINFKEKLYIGSMELFDNLGNNSSYNERLKHNQKRRILMNGNFDMTNPNLFKMRKNYKNYTKYMKKYKNLLLEKDIKNKNLDENTISENDSIKNKRSNKLHKTHNLFLDYKSNIIQNNTFKNSLFKSPKHIKQHTNRYPKYLNNTENNSDIINNNKNSQNNFFNSPNLKPISKEKKNLFLKTFSNSKENNKLISNYKNEITKTENNEKKAIEAYGTKSIKFSEYFKQKKNFQKYIDSYNKTLKGKIFSSNNSNNKIRDSLNNFIINNEKYVKRKSNFFQKKIEEPYNEFKEDSRNEEKFNKFAKNVDFSKKISLSLKSNINDNINSMNMASFKIRLGNNIPIREYIKKMKKKKEKEKEQKILKSVKFQFKKNSKIIHNLTISLDGIKRKYNY